MKKEKRMEQMSLEELEREEIFYSKNLTIGIYALILFVVLAIVCSFHYIGINANLGSFIIILSGSTICILFSIFAYILYFIKKLIICDRIKTTKIVENVLYTKNIWDSYKFSNYNVDLMNKIIEKAVEGIELKLESGEFQIIINLKCRNTFSYKIGNNPIEVIKTLEKR